MVDGGGKTQRSIIGVEVKSLEDRSSCFRAEAGRGQVGRCFVAFPQ